MMPTTNTTTAVGVFDSPAAAERAAADLRSVGFPENDIGVAGDMESAAGGAAAGLGTAGALIFGAAAMAGYAAAWILLFYPALGLAYIGAAAMAALALVAGVWGVVGFARDSAVRWRAAPAVTPTGPAGRVFLTVRAGNRYDEAIAVLRRHGASELEWVAPSRAA
ncbi:MAG TPA: hypothetical protein VKD90_11760 [Gemmataceae bacterium]|nr:hypothetical protein [Gemmataceae bacterium]